MIGIDEVYKIGRLGKAHGVKGEVTMMFTDDAFDRVDCDCLILMIDGILVPFFIEEYRFRSGETALVKFEDVDTQQRAAALTGCDVYFLRRLADEETDGVITWSRIVGFDVVNAADGRKVGKIGNIDETTENVLLELEDGTLIPAADDMIEEVDMAERTISLTIPDGLLEL